MKRLQDLDEREMLALAISNEEEDGRLFADFAQWFTDGFLMTDQDRRRTRTNHQIDLSQLYGLEPAVTAVGGGGGAPPAPRATARSRCRR